MEVFSTVVVEISATAFASLPAEDYEGRRKIHSAESIADEGFDAENAALATNNRARFLEEKLKELNVSVVVMSEKLADTASSLKLCGGWSEMCAVRMWLMQFIQAADSMQNVSNAAQLKAGAMCKAAVTESCMETTANKPRRGLRNRHPAKQAYNADAVLLQSPESSKQIKAKRSKQKISEKKKTMVHLRNEAASKSGISDKTDKMLESCPNYVTEAETNVSDSVKPMMLGDEHIARVTSIMENDGGVSELCSGLRQQLKEELQCNRSEPKSTPGQLKCSLCDYVTGKRRNLALHVARTHSDRHYVCPTCNRRFGIAKDLKYHLKCHTEQYCCEQCGRTLKSKYALALHISRIHKGVAPRPVKRYLCTICGKMCRNRTDYNVHRNKEHTGLRPFQCDLCNASFFAKSNLRAHHQVHADGRKFECQQCGKAFKQRQGLRIHLTVHLAERPFKCAICSKAFTQHSALLRHTRTHTSSRPYTCRICPSSFNDYSVLRRHMIGIHKVQDATELRLSIQAACAEARLAERPSAVSFEGLHPTNSVTNAVGNTSAASTISEDTSTSATATTSCVDMAAGIPLKSDAHLGASAGQLLALLSSSQGHRDAHVSIAETLPRYFFIDTWRSVDSHHNN